MGSLATRVVACLHQAVKQSIIFVSIASGSSYTGLTMRHGQALLKHYGTPVPTECALKDAA
jgi:hypothetical protein